MADSFPDPDGDRDTGVGIQVGSDLGPAPSMPLWVKVFGIAFLVLVLLFVVMMASGHGPGRHMPGISGLGGPVSAASATEYGGRPL
jgi:hypothetical protein